MCKGDLGGPAYSADGDLVAMLSEAEKMCGSKKGSLRQFIGMMKRG